MRSLYVLRVGKEGGSEPRLLFEYPFVQDAFQLAPDQKWIAHHSNESGRFEVYVATFPDFSRKRPVSGTGGRQPQWRGDGKELFYLGLDGKLMSVEVKAGATLETGIPEVLFQTLAQPAQTVANQRYCVTKDGQRFLFIEPVEGKAEPIHVVLNWTEELKRLVPTEN